MSIRCQVRMRRGKKEVAFELLPKDLTDPTMIQCRNRAASLTDWGEGRSTLMCLKHEAQALGVRYTSA